MLDGVVHEERRATNAAVVCGALVAAGYVALLWLLDAAPFQDLPLHLTRAAIETDIVLHGGERFGSDFAFAPAFTPYIGGDAVLASLVAAFGPGVAARLWVILVAASFPVALAIYLRAARYSGYSILIASILALYLATDWFFLSGMHHFRLAVACVLMALAAWEVWLRSAWRGAYVAWMALVAVGYLIHLSALLFTAAGAASIAVVAYVMRQTNWRRIVAGLAPLFAAVLWQLSMTAVEAEGDVRTWGSATRKLVALVAPFARYEWPADGALLLGFAIAAGLLVVGSRVGRSDGRFVSAVLLTLTYLALYVAMPFASGRFSHLDVRAVPLAATFALVAALAAAESAGRHSRAAVWVALLVALGNLALLERHLVRHNRTLRAYRVMAARIPRDARVLPIATRPLDGFTNPFLHAGAFATLDAGAFMPYLSNGGATPYFRYRTPPDRRLSPFWYQMSENPDGGTRADIASNFQYLLVMNPFDPGRLPVAAEVVAKSHIATLLRVLR